MQAMPAPIYFAATGSMATSYYKRAAYLIKTSIPSRV